MLKSRLNPEILKFFMVGLSALSVHLMIVWLLVNYGNWQPLPSNIFGFLGAVNISYFGHLHLTFNQSHQLSLTSYVKFFVIASAGFLINQSLYFYALNWFGNHFYLPILTIILLAVAVITYVLSKFWAFKPKAFYKQ